MKKNEIDIIKDLWQVLANEKAHGLVKRALDLQTNLRMYCTFDYSKEEFGIAFSFDSGIHVDMSSVDNLSNIRVSLYDDKSYPNANLVVIQLLDHDARAFDIFAYLCGNVVAGVIEKRTEKECVKCVFDRIRKWEEIFAKKYRNALSAQEQSGLFGELYFIKKLATLKGNIAFAIDSWYGSSASVQDFITKDWNVEVKTALLNATHLTINGELQLDETCNDLFLFCLLVESDSGNGKSLPEIIQDIRNDISNDKSLYDAFNLKLLKAGYYDSDVDVYKNKFYTIRRESFYHVNGNFPRIKKDELRKGVSRVKYMISLSELSSYMITETDFNNIISKS